MNPVGARMNKNRDLGVNNKIRRKGKMMRKRRRKEGLNEEEEKEETGKFTLGKHTRNSYVLVTFVLNRQYSQFTFYV